VINAITAAAAQYAKGGYSVLVDGIVGPWFVELVAETFADHGVRWHYAILLPANDVSVERSRSRSKTTTQEVLEKMHSEFTAHLSGYEKHVVDSSHLDATQTAEAVNKKMETGANCTSGRNGQQGDPRTPLVGAALSNQSRPMDPARRGP
jgi:hypothetical protein